MNITTSSGVQHRLRELGIVPTLLERPVHMTAEQVLLAVRVRNRRAPLPAA